jgi:cell wall-associated NlpC family hydrolase
MACAEPLGTCGVAVVVWAVALCLASGAGAQIRISVELPRPRASDDALARVLAGVDAAVRVAERASREPGRRTGDATRWPTPPAPTSPAGSPTRVLPTAERYLGVPYRWGGTSPKTGFDCSGFVQYVFAKHGTRLPRTSREQASAGRRLRPVWASLRPGDLVMFAEPGARISHVAIYAGRRRIIHATASGRRVRYDALDTQRGRWFAKRIVAARRVSPRGPALVRELLAGALLADELRVGEPLYNATIDLVLDPPDRAPPPDHER